MRVVSWFATIFRIRIDNEMGGTETRLTLSQEYSYAIVLRDAVVCHPPSTISHEDIDAGTDG